MERIQEEIAPEENSDLQMPDEPPQPNPQPTDPNAR